MKKAILAAFLIAALSGCSPYGESGLSRPARAYAPLAMKNQEQRSADKYLAYEHSISIDAEESSIKPLYEKLVASCNADTASGCTVLNSNLTTGRYMSASIRVRAKPAGIKALADVAATGGTVSSQGTRVEDLARPVIESNKRLDMLKQYQKRLLDLEQRSRHDADSLIKLSKELATVQTELEAASGEHAQLMARINMDTLDISISPHANRSFWAPIGNAFTDFSSTLSSGVASAISGFAALLPSALLLLVVFLLGRKWWKRRK